MDRNEKAMRICENLRILNLLISKTRETDNVYFFKVGLIILLNRKSNRNFKMMPLLNKPVCKMRALMCTQNVESDRKYSSKMIEVFKFCLVFSSFSRKSVSCIFVQIKSITTDQLKKVFIDLFLFI